MISEHLPALQVVLPLISAPLIVVVRRESFAWFLATAVSWIGASDRNRSRSAHGPSGRHLVRSRKLAAALGYRVPRGPAQRLRARPRLCRRCHRHVVCAHERGSGSRERAALSVLFHVLPVPCRAAWHNDHRRRLQPVRVPRDFLAVLVRAHRDGAAPKGALLLHSNT